MHKYNFVSLTTSEQTKLRASPVISDPRLGTMDLWKELKLTDGRDPSNPNICPFYLLQLFKICYTEKI